MRLSKIFNPVEYISFIYILVTAIFIVVFSCKIENWEQLLCCRAVIAGATVGMAVLSAKLVGNKLLAVVRFLFPGFLIVYWYPETYYLNMCIFNNLDHLFVQMDQLLFGCQPSMLFSAVMPWAWFSELMSFGYLSYYFITVFVTLYLYFTNRAVAYKALFIILCSFFIYYVLFIIIPVVGPQFYYHSPDDYVPSGYLCRNLLIAIQDAGEKPTGAFPSSHVGICVVLMVLIYKYIRKYFVYFIPIAIVLIMSTVYIKAHYLIDVFGGFVTAPLVYWLSLQCWNKITEGTKFSLDTKQD